MRSLILVAVLLALAASGLKAAEQLQTVEQLYMAGQYVDRAQKYQEMGLWDEAENEYWNAVSLDFDNVPARLGLGEVLRRKQEFLQAIENYQIVLKQQPNNVDVQYMISLSYYDNHEYGKAKEAADKALQMNPDLAKAENLVRLSDVKNQEQTQVMAELSAREDSAFVVYRQAQDLKENAMAGNLIPGWRLIQTGEGRPMWTGYTLLGSTVGMFIGGYMLRKAGASSYTKATQALSTDVYQSLANTGQTRYKAGGYMIDAALSITLLNLFDSYILHHRIFRGRTRVKPSLPPRDRHSNY